MKHFGDITKLNGAELPVVDVITGGSPCQDLSIAGQRKGLAGERSGLFMEQIRIIKEMREHDRASGRSNEHIRPRFMVLENVPGAFSSNKGEDFRAILEETTKIADENAVIPRPAGNKWANSGCIMGNGWSIAWRVHNAQFWGVPQRRKRIALVADFGGQSAPEILFERKGLSGDFEQGGTEREETAGTVGNGIEKASEPTLLESNQNHATIRIDEICTALPASMGMGGGYVPMVCSKAISFQERAGKPGGGKGILIQNERTGALSTLNNQNVLCLNGQHGRQPILYNGESITSPTNKSLPKAGDPCHTLGTDSRNYVVYDARGNGDGNVCPTITGDHENRITDYTAVCIGNGQMCNMSMKPIANTLDTMHDQQVVMTFGLDRASFNQGQNALYDFSVERDLQPTITAKGPGAVEAHAVVRRLTPLECTRLQGYPDGWVDIGEWTDSKGKIHKDADSPKYKALGNSIALPFWQWMADRIVNQLKNSGVENPAMGSLFDGISGFPLVFARCGARPLWTSEIEEFPIAVCKAHFGDEDVGIEGDIEKYL